MMVNLDGMQRTAQQWMARHPTGKSFTKNYSMRRRIDVDLHPTTAMQTLRQTPHTARIVVAADGISPEVVF
jgi:hypothetical protein